MIRIIACLLFAFVTVDNLWAQDPIKTDGDKYKVVFENERVRILAYRDKPGDKTLVHAHPDFVVVSRSTFKRRLTLPSGKSAEREFKPGEFMWLIRSRYIPLPIASWAGRPVAYLSSAVSAN
jgi:beta-alanine degradation protein BauB